MNVSEPFILRPVGTSLLMAAIMLSGMVAYSFLPLSTLPEVDYPTIQVQTLYPGASPEVMTSSVTAPLERQFGQMPGLNQMTSASSGGASVITLQFSLDLSLDIAEQEVQAAINAAGNLLPADLPAPPIYSKVNPADAPILALAITSKTLKLTDVENLVETRLAQKISQLTGVGLVSISGGERPAVRIQLNPDSLAAYGLAVDDIRTTIGNLNVNTPKGNFDGPAQALTINANDQLTSSDQYSNLIVAYRNGGPVRMSDIATIISGPENTKLGAWANTTPAIILNVQRQPGANIIQVVDRIQQLLPQIMATMPSAVDIAIIADRTVTIRASVADVEFELSLAVVLVVLVIFVFLRTLPGTIIPSLSVPLSLVGTFGAMYLLGFSLDNLSLMALTIATGFVVDDAIVVLENITRHLEEGMPRVQAALTGARDIGFTVVSITVSLVVVFLPILLMGGIVGRLFREFALTLSLAILVSMAISLTTTPMMCALMLRLAPRSKNKPRRSLIQIVQDGYARSLTTVLDHSFAVLCTLIATIALNVWLIRQIPKDFFPLQDTGMMIASLVADQSVSFQLLSQKFTQMMSIVEHDPAVQHVVGSAGSGSGGRASQLNTAAIYVSLKPLGQRDGIQVVMGRLRRELGRIPGARLYLIPVQDIRVGGRSSNATYQYTILGDTTAEVYKWAPKLLAELEKDKTTFTDLNSDQQQNGLETEVTVDRDTASRLGLTMYQIDNTLYDAFGQRSVSTIYQALNQYHVVMEVAPQYWQRPSTLNQIWVSTSGGQPSGSATSQLSAGSVSAGTATGVTTAFVALSPPFTPPLSSATASAANASTTVSNNVVPLSNNVVSLALSTASTSSTTSGSSSTSLAANNAVRTAAQATIASTGNSVASTGASVATSVETMVPLSAFVKYAPGNTPLAVNHQSEFVATTISFNLAEGKSLSDAEASIQRAVHAINMPSDLIGGFAGTALVYQQSLSNELFLVLAALAAVYIVLGILYESFIHPLTILSTLPSAGVGP